MPIEDANKPVTLTSAFDALRAELERLPDAIEAAPKGQGVDLTALNDAVDTADKAARDEVRTQQDALTAKQGELQTAQARVGALEATGANPLGRDAAGYVIGWPGSPETAFAPGSAPPETLVSPGLTLGRSPDFSATGEAKPAAETAEGVKEQGEPPQ